MSAALADEAPQDMYVDLSATDSQTSAIPSSPLSPRRRARLEILKEEQPSNKRRNASPENTPAPAGPAFTATGTRLVENLDMRMYSINSALVSSVVAPNRDKL
ncbi:hypothetical protein M405DRAFT_937438 [Rhizopogon salebrosus TDB-379]|nr:hypothetical protein M405DRAFT_937438 [Rhizopogon salebrosus TDB-379]